MPIVIALVSVAVVYVWLVAASAIYCSITGKPDLFAFPYTVWIDTLLLWRSNWLMPFLVVISALGPTLVVGGLLWSVPRRIWRRASLYGNSSFATERQMRKNGIITRRQPF